MLIRFPDDRGSKYEYISYPAGECQVRLTNKSIVELFHDDRVEVLARNAHVLFMELALLADAIHELCPFALSTLILPYLPYSRADRRFCEGDCAGLKVFGEHLGSLRFNRIRTLDVHSYRAAKLVPNLENIMPMGFIAQAIVDIAKHNGYKSPAILLPDEGAKRYALRTEGMSLVQCSKKRNAATGKLTGFEVPEFKESAALIVDDICDGGGTFVGIAEKLPRHVKKYLYVTHGIFSKGFECLLEGPSAFEKIFTTNSIYPDRVGVNGGGLYFPNKKLEVFDCEPLLLESK